MTTRQDSDKPSSIRSDRDPLLDIEGIAAHLGVSVRHVRRLVAERRIPFIKWGQRLHFDRAAVDAWVDQHRVEPEAS